MSHAPSAVLERRLDTIRRACQGQSIDALVITSMPNLLYLSNFNGSAAIGVVTDDRLYLITDFRYLALVEATRATPYECPGLELVRVDSSYDEALASLLGAKPHARVGFEAAHLTVSRHRWLEKRLEGTGAYSDLVPTEGIVEQARSVKDAYELSTLREAARRLSEVAGGVFNEIRRGRSEREVAMAIDRRIREGGFDRPAFDTIVAGGPNAALPHARPGERILTEGDLVVLDFGGVYDSYCVDLTRTISVGSAGTRAKDVYAAVRDAHDRAIAAVSPNRSRFAIDAAARDALGARGFGDAFGHGTGHGLGLEVHEDPRIARRRPEVDPEEDPVFPGMVFTIEPGAYFPGWAGVRIEDDVVVTDDGVAVITEVTTELLEL
jgi:Xaa-Pro aminopeptidase